MMREELETLVIGLCDHRLAAIEERVAALERVLLEKLGPGHWWCPALPIGGVSNLLRPNRWPPRTLGMQSKRRKRVHSHRSMLRTYNTPLPERVFPKPAQYA
jgi:hypothetical protein